MGDGRFGVEDVAEDDGAGGAALGAGGGDLAVLDEAPLVLGVVPGGVNALDAEGALLHHPSRAHRQIGIEHLPCRLRSFVPPPVEAAHLVGTVVRAVARPHAAVIDLDIEPLGVVIGGVDGAHRLAGGGGAVLAEHRKELNPAGGVVPRLDTQPRHLTSLHVVFQSGDRNVVFDVAGRGAGPAPVAARQIDGHRPAVLGILDLGVETHPLVSLVVVRIGDQAAPFLRSGSREDGCRPLAARPFDPQFFQEKDELSRRLFKPVGCARKEAALDGEDPFGKTGLRFGWEIAVPGTRGESQDLSVADPVLARIVYRRRNPFSPGDGRQGIGHFVQERQRAAAAVEMADGGGDGEERPPKRGRLPRLGQKIERPLGVELKRPAFDVLFDETPLCKGFEAVVVHRPAPLGEEKVTPVLSPVAHE